MYAFADKLLEVSERHAAKIADQWCRAVKSNPHTPWFQSMKSDDLQPLRHGFLQELP